MNLHGQGEGPLSVTEDSRDHRSQSLKFASSHRIPIPEGILWPTLSMALLDQTHVHHVMAVTGGYSWRWDKNQSSHCSPCPSRLSWEEKPSLGRRDSWINFPKPSLAAATHVPVLTHPQGCQGLKEVALSETIIRDFIICFSSLRTNSSLQHANLLFKFQTPKWPSNTLLGMH